VAKAEPIAAVIPICALSMLAYLCSLITARHLPRCRRFHTANLLLPSNRNLNGVGLTGQSMIIAEYFCLSV
jgi:hypothetical protein